jgi:hypothetical protein
MGFARGFSRPGPCELQAYGQEHLFVKLKGEIRHVRGRGFRVKHAATGALNPDRRSQRGRTREETGYGEESTENIWDLYIVL